jgi:nitrogen fixation NifU-like protein
MDQEREELYQAILLDHETSPRNFHPMDDATHVETGVNPVCGDRFKVYLRLHAGQIERASFEGRGCTLSKASASMMSSMLTGISVRQALAIRLSLREALDLTNEGETQITGELEALLGVRTHPSRIACVMLAWDAMAKAVAGNDE